MLAALLSMLAPAAARAADLATPTFVQTRGNEVNSGFTNAQTFDTANTAGNLIVAYVLWNNGATSTPTLSDTRGNTYQSAGPPTIWHNGWGAQVFYAKNIAGGVNTVTAEFPLAINSFALVYLHEYSGVDKFDPLDGYSGNFGSTTAMNSGTVNTTKSGDLLWAGGASTWAVTGNAGEFTVRHMADGNRTMDRILPTAGAYSASMTQGNSGWVMNAVAFKRDTGSDDVTPPEVAISEPESDAQLSGIVNVTADATDDTEIHHVQFQVDGVDTGAVDNEPPYALAWDTRTVANGDHTIRARAYDSAGNSTLSDPVHVEVRNAATFQNEILLSGLSLPTAMKFLPDGRMLVSELQGRIRVVPAPYTSVNPGNFLQIDNIGVAGVQQGIYDFVLDPNFAVNHYYYVFYTLGLPNHDRVSRFTANALLNGTVPGSELVLYEDTQDADAEHHGGALNFANDGKLLFTTGEHFDAPASQDLTNPRGKIHRINPDGTVPTDNPFYDGAGPNYDSVWAYGLRNPYRAYYDAPTDRLIFGDVGGNDNRTAIEEVNVGARGANFGWADIEGPCTAPCTGPIYSYHHNLRDAAVTGGFVYHGNQFPSGFKGNYFFADYTQNWIKRMTFGADGKMNGVYNFEPLDGSVDGPYGDIVYLVEGPDGAIYYLDLGYSDISGTWGVSKLRRIRYIAGNQPPTAQAAANPTTGAAPLTVNFSSAGSADPEGQPLTYQWTFGDGETSTAANPAHVYTAPGTYSARLSVSDGENATQSSPVTIRVGEAPTGTILTPSDGGTFVAGDTISFSGTGTDPDDGELPASAFTWNVDFLHDGHVHPGQVWTGTKSGSYEIPTTGHDYSGNTRYRITLTVRDSNGLLDTKSVIVWPRKVDLTFNAVPAGTTLYLDGIAKQTPFTYDTLTGFQHTIEARDQALNGTPYVFDSWSDGGAREHTITVPASSRSYTAQFEVAPQPSTPTFVQTRAGEVNSGTTNVVAFDSANTAGNLIVVHVMWNNGNTDNPVLTDTRGNTYAPAGPKTIWYGGWASQVFYAKNIAGGANTVTARFGSTINSFALMYLHEYAGLDRTDPLDGQSVGFGASNAMDSGLVTTTRPGDLLFAAGASTWAVTGTALDFTVRSTADANRTMDKVLGAAGQYRATMTQSNSGWVLHAVAFKAAPSGPVDEPPTAAAQANRTSGPAPLSVDFSSSGSADPEGEPLSYLWTFGDGETSTAANPTHVYTAPGEYTAHVAVSDGTSTTESTPITIHVGEPPTAAITTPSSGTTFAAGETLSFSGTGTDPDDGDLPASAFTWTVEYLHGSTTTTAATRTGVKTGTFTVPTTGVDFSGDARYRITLAVKDANGLTDTTSVTVQPRKVDLTFTTAPAGMTVHVDGVARATPFTLDAAVGSQHTIEARDQDRSGTPYTFDSWSDGGAREHTITAGSTGRTYTAAFKVAPQPSTPTFVQTRAGEVNSGSTNVVAFSGPNTAGNLIVVHLMWNNATTPTLSDTRGNTYAPAGPRTTWYNGWGSQVFYAKNIAGGENTVTAQFSGTINGFALMYVHEYAGLDRTDPLDGQSVGFGATNAMDSGLVTTTRPGDLLFAAGASTWAVTSTPADFTVRSTADSNRTMDKVLGAAGQYGATMTQSNSGWVLHAVAFKAATPTNQAPVAQAEADRTSGPAPLSVDFSSAGSSDPEGQPLTYSWAFGDGQTSTAANPTHVYDAPGEFNARLTVSDGENSTQSTAITIHVGEPPTAAITTPSTGTTFAAGDTLSFTGTGTDPDDGDLPASAFTWTVEYLRGSTTTTAATRTGVKTGTFAVPTSGVDFSGDARYRITLAVKDANGLTDTTSVTVQPRKVNLTLNTVPAGMTVHVDGTARPTPYTLDTAVGSEHTIDARNQAFNGRPYAFGSWSDAGAQAHTITAGDTDRTYTATMTELEHTAPPAFVQTKANEIGSGTSNPVAFDSPNTAGNLIVAYVIWSNQSTVSLSDSGGNTYATAGTRRTWGSNWSSQVFYAKNVAGGANTVTAQFASSVGWGVVYVHEYSGIDPVDTLDTQTSAIGTTRAMDSGPLTMTGAGLLFNAGASSHAVTASGPDYATRSTAFSNRTQDRVSYAAGTYNATMTQDSDAWVSHLVAFKAIHQ